MKKNLFKKYRFYNGGVMIGGTGTGEREKEEEEEEEE